MACRDRWPDGQTSPQRSDASAIEHSAALAALAVLAVLTVAYSRSSPAGADFPASRAGGGHPSAPPPLPSAIGLPRGWRPLTYHISRILTKQRSYAGEDIIAVTWFSHGATWAERGGGWPMGLPAWTAPGIGPTLTWHWAGIGTPPWRSGPGLARVLDYAPYSILYTWACGSRRLALSAVAAKAGVALGVAATPEMG